MLRRVASCLAFSLLLRGSLGQEAPLEFFVNNGAATNVQVNALHFINEGDFLVNSAIPWDAQNTLTFTNRGNMDGSPGFIFETVSASGQKSPAASFFNGGNGSISISAAGGGFFFGGGFGGFGVPNAITSASLLEINAVGLTNRGDITADGIGIIKLFGQNVDLSGSTVMINPSIGGGGAFGAGVNVGDTNFTPAAAVYDVGWGIGNNGNFSPATIVTSTNSAAARLTLTNESGVCSGVLNLRTAKLWYRDAMVNPSNRVIQVIAADVADTNIIIGANFQSLTFPGGPLTSGYLSPLVEFSVASTNYRTFTMQTNSLYVFNQLGAASTNFVVAQNLRYPNTFRPQPIMVFRGSPGLTKGGTAGKTNTPKTVLTDPSFAEPPGSTNKWTYYTTTVTNVEASYGAEIQAMAMRLPDLPDLGVTNLSGRVEISAKDLTLDTTRIRAESLLTINATNMTVGSDTILDSPLLTLNLTATTNLLRLPDVTPSSVERFAGFLQAYSAAWTNLYDVPGPDPADPTNTVTNTIEVHLEAFVVSGRDLHTREPVITQSLNLSSPGQISYEDNLRVTNRIQINTPTLVLATNSFLYVSPGLGFSDTNILNVSTFTNFGTLQLNDFAVFRKNENTGYDRFVNRGNLIAYGVDVTTSYFENGGNITSSNNYGFSGGGVDCFGRPSIFPVAQPTIGPIQVTAETANFTGGTLMTSGDVSLSGDVFKFMDTTIVAEGRLLLGVTGVLTDNGDASNNLWVTGSGFEMHTRPQGNLIGTELQTIAPRLAFIDNYWSAQDQGPSLSAFANNNLALGRLLIQGDFGSKFRFLQGAPNSAIYVGVLAFDGLQATSLAAITNRIALGMNIYFAALESTNTAITAANVDHIFGPNAPYNFIWVQGFAAPGGSAQQLGVLSNVSVEGAPGDPASIAFAFSAKSAGTYLIEYTTNLSTPDWRQLKQVTDKDALNGMISVTDKTKPVDSQRFYRVRLVTQQ
jgi:hypothetical protein